MEPGRTRAINPHLSTGAHVLGALPDAERAEFEAHLDRCQGCADEVAGLRETAGRLGNAVDHVVPGDLRPHVLAAVRHARQVSPAFGLGAFFSRRRGFRRAAALISAAFLTAAVVAGAHGALTTSRITPVAANPRTQIADLLSAPDLRLVTAGNLVGTAAISLNRNQMLFLMGDLPTLPRDRDTSFGLVHDHGPRPDAILRPTGKAMSLLVTGIEEVGKVILTVEPASGSSSPTGTPVLAIILV